VEILFSIRGFRLEQLELAFPRLSAEGLTAVHLSDLHMREWGPQHERLVREVNGRRVDMVLVTGDFVSREPDSLGLFCRLAGALRAEHGVFACRGNWEVRWGPPLDELCAALRAAGVRLLVNESHTVMTRAGRVRVCGVDDLWRGEPDVAAACRGGEAELVVLLSHAPAAARALPGGHGVDLVLSGHTHGGQVRIPLLWRLFLPHCTGGFVDGLFETGGVKLYVSRGFGACGTMPFRFRCPAEAAFLRLNGGGAKPSI
jgi:predicted MPP superfamily phosphohydrolase